jgi:DNA repair protein RadA/Sms
MGFCPQCKSDGALQEVAADGPAPAAERAARVVPLSEAGGTAVTRRPIGIAEIDRVLGGGLVPGATLLVGGEPGVGKSTLLLQAAGSLAAAGGEVLVAGAEESLEQVGLRAARLGVQEPGVLLASERDVDAVIAAADRIRPDLLVVDSIQAVAAPEVAGAPGGVTQVRESAARLVHFAKETGVPVAIVGHVTKDGGIAGPKVLEHAVDVVLYLEGDVERGLRVLRGLKNRFGPAHRFGLFEMRETGMAEVADPSGWLVARWQGGVPGSVVFPAVDGRRPLLVEIQALVADSATTPPRRSVKGLEAARVHQVLAVLERHLDVSFARKEVYVSVVGGIRVQDPGADLPVAIAVISSLLGQGLEPTAAWGEVGLTGEVRAVAHGDRRAEEVARLGIEVAVGPTGSGGDDSATGRGGAHIATALGRAGLLKPPSDIRAHRRRS